MFTNTTHYFMLLLRRIICFCCFCYNYYVSPRPAKTNAENMLTLIFCIGQDLKLCPSRHSRNRPNSFILAATHFNWHKALVFNQNVTALLCFRADHVKLVWLEGWNTLPGYTGPLRVAETCYWSASRCRGCSLDRDILCNETTGWPRWPSSSPRRYVCPRRTEARSRRAGKNDWAPARQRRERLNWCFV